MNRIDEAREYIRQRIMRSALMHPDLDETTKNKVRNADRWLGHFERVGDLLVYLKRFEVGTEAETYKHLKAHGLETFEDIVGDFEKRFSKWADDKTTFNDFVIGQKYNSFQILIFVGSYDTRSGGMFVIGNEPNLDAVVIKATLEGGKYPNKWIEPHQALKYYLKSRKEIFGENYIENAAIIKNHSIPICTFVRESENDEFIYEGVFFYNNLRTEKDGSKWFELKRAADPVEQEVVTSDFLDTQLKQKVEESRKLSVEERRRRLVTSAKRPRTVTVQTTGFIRNADVIAEVLERANGICEGCQTPAPFRRKKDSTPYLEVHHKIQLSNGGEDTVENALALCPNCHRKEHYG